MPKASILRTTSGKVTASEASKNAPLQWGDLVRTEAAGRARIVLEDQSVLTLGSNSMLRVVQHDHRSQQTALELAYGRIRCQVKQITSNKSRFQLRTPTAVAGVIGTDFGADSSNPGETRFLCLSGTVRITSLDPNITAFADCAPGMMVIVRRGQAPSPAVPAEAELLERWQHITEPGDEEFAKSVPPMTDTPDNIFRESSPFAWAKESISGKRRVHGIEVGGSIRFRAEGWKWFETPTFQDDYAFAHSVIKLDVGRRGKRFDWKVEIEQPSVFGAPERAIAPGEQGQLGLGATYFAANGGRSTSAGIFPSQLNLGWHGFAGDERNRFTLGRFRFVDGAETTPSDPTIAWLKRVRIAHRLIGDFAFTATGRSHDGLSLSLNKKEHNLTFAAARPTMGVFQTSGLGEVDAAWAYGAWTASTHQGRGEWRLFGLGYGDARATIKSDNRPLALRAGAETRENINLGTFGGNYLFAHASASAGIFDLMLWGVVQTGDWGTQSHRAAAAAVEAGWQPDIRWKPWLRLGYAFGSGDDDPADGKHGTFFPVLPTPRQYARYPFYNSQNNHDVSAMLILRPTPRLTLRSEAHLIRLASSNDLWYSGGGAFSNSSFGYSGRSSGGSTRLANVWDLSADYKLSPHWNLNGYIAHAWGGEVVKRIYPASSGSTFGYGELEFRF